MIYILDSIIDHIQNNDNFLPSSITMDLNSITLKVEEKKIEVREFLENQKKS